MSVPPEVAYVTACALGLAFSEHDPDDAVAALVTAADGCPDTLHAARVALPTYPSPDASVLQAADELLGSAEVATRLSGSAVG